MITFETSVCIGRPVEEVFGYVSDPRNFPDWNSAVTDVKPTSAKLGDVGATYTMERQLPGRHATNRLEIVGHESPREFAVRASAGPTPFLYRFSFAGSKDRTVLHLGAEIELGGRAAALAPFARRGVKSGVEDNLARLKWVLERS